MNQLGWILLMICRCSLLHTVFYFLENSLPLDVGQPIPKLFHAIVGMLVAGICSCSCSSQFERFDGGADRGGRFIVPLRGEIVVASVVLALVLRKWAVICILALTLKVTLAVYAVAVSRKLVVTTDDSWRIFPSRHFFLLFNNHRFMLLIFRLIFQFCALIDQTLDFAFIF